MSSSLLGRVSSGHWLCRTVSSPLLQRERERERERGRGREREREREGGREGGRERGCVDEEKERRKIQQGMKIERNKMEVIKNDFLKGLWCGVHFTRAR